LRTGAIELIFRLGAADDDAIVVGEHADTLARTRGLSPIAAAEQAAVRMGDRRHPVHRPGRDSGQPGRMFPGPARPTRVMR
jgi:hypothetical protein